MSCFSIIQSFAVSLPVTLGGHPYEAEIIR
ncbi:MAG: hypothetical protein RLZZ214_1712 [Verrucomicrobiota bacterium]|jgi:hypothetical protein